MTYTPLPFLLTALLASSPSGAFGGKTNIFDHPDAPEKPSGPHQGCKLLLKENHDPQEMLVGKAFEEKTTTGYKVENEAGATAATCTNGLAGGYACNAVDLLSMLDLSQLNEALGSGGANDVWGWTDSSSGREFAIIGMRSGTAFVEITNSNSPVYLGGLATHTSSSSWRDIKTYNNYAIIGSEASGHGLQIFDLTELLTASPSTEFTHTAHYDDVSNSHNVFVNEDTGFAYAVGTNTCNGGLHVVNMNNPTSPASAGCFSNDGYTHDVQCVVYNGPDETYSGKEICFASNEDTITVIDVSDKNNMVQLDKRTYAGDAYTHQGWLTDDHSYFIYNDELDEARGITSKTRTHVMDVRDLNNIQYVGYHDGRTAAIDHNLYVKGDLVFQANYRAGLNVLKMTDISSSEFEEVGYFDIYNGSNSANFNGAWSNYPYFPSGTIVVSGIEQGLFVLKYTGGQGTPSPTPLPSASPSSPPVNGPTDPPTAPPTAPPTQSPTEGDGECNDGTSFYFKGTTTKECSWLSEQRRGKRRNFCTKRWKYGEVNGVTYGPPDKVCRGTCEEFIEDICESCYQKNNSRFFLRKNTKRNKTIKKSCTWLSGKPDQKITTICNNDNQDPDGVYPSVSVSCPETCGLCS